jgi:HAD superfamily hydrolase (TIGR01549 family)
MLKAVIFDIDGTLVDSVDLHAQAWQEAFRHFGHDIPYELVRHQIGQGGDHLIPVFLAPHEVAKYGAELDRYRSTLFKRDYLSRVRAFPWVRELFERIRSVGERIALASSAKGDELAAYKRIARITDLVEEQTSADDVAHSKPSPDIFAAALQKLRNVDASEAIAVGDTPYDAEAAGKLGLRTVGLLCGGFPKSELRGAGCVAIYRDPAGLLAHFAESPLAETAAQAA